MSRPCLLYVFCVAEFDFNSYLTLSSTAFLYPQKRLKLKKFLENKRGSFLTENHCLKSLGGDHWNPQNQPYVIEGDCAGSPSDSGPCGGSFRHRPEVPEVSAG